jgi:hypothetical protein
MAEFFVWLLISVGNGTYYDGTVHTVAQFKTVEECSRVQAVIFDNGGHLRERTTRCIQAKIYK